MPGLLQKLKVERAQVADQLAALRSALKEFDTAIAALEGVSAPVVRQTSGRPTLKDAIVQVLDNNPMTSDEVLTAVNARSGFDTSQSSIASTLSRLKADGQIDRNSNGQWHLPVQETPEASGGSPASDVGASLADY